MTTSCIDEYPLNVTDYENLLVVDGLLTNGPGPYEVKLSYSTSLSYPAFRPVQNAELFFEDNEGTLVPLIELDEGIYYPTDSSFRGQTGKSYRLLVKLLDGTQYATKFSRLRSPVEIDSIYYKIESVPTDNPDYKLNGCRFYLNTALPVEDSIFYLWRLTETYEYHSAFKIEYYYEGRIKPFYNSDSLFYCWKTDVVPDVFVQSGVNKTENQFTDYPLNFVSVDSYRLSVLYSLLVSQLIIDKPAYDFWNAVKDQLNDDNLLFNKQFYQVRGNLKNINNPEEPVMGYFTVAGEYRQRIFTRPPLDLISEIKQPSCVPDTELRWLWYTRPYQWPIFLVKDGDLFGTGDDYCFDCRENGGELTKPNFWPDDD